MWRKKIVCACNCAKVGFTSGDSAVFWKESESSGIGALLADWHDVADEQYTDMLCIPTFGLFQSYLYVRKSGHELLLANHRIINQVNSVYDLHSRGT